MISLISTNDIRSALPVRTVTFTRAYMFYTVIFRCKNCGYSLEPLNLLKKEKNRVYPYTI